MNMDNNTTKDDSNNEYKSKLDNRATLEQIGLTHMKKVEDEIRGKDLSILTSKEKKWLEKLDKDILSASGLNNYAPDEVPVPFELPPCSKKGDKFLPEGYEYIEECHLNWQRVYTYKISTWEVVGVVESIHQCLILPGNALCCQGKCPKAECKPENFKHLVARNKYFPVWQKKEADTKESCYYIGKKMRVFKDEYGYTVGTDGFISKEESVLNPSVIYKKRVCICTSAKAESNVSK